MYGCAVLYPLSFKVAIIITMAIDDRCARAAIYSVSRFRTTVGSRNQNGGLRRNGVNDILDECRWGHYFYGLDEYFNPLREGYIALTGVEGRGLPLPPPGDSDTQSVY